MPKKTKRLLQVLKKQFVDRPPFWFMRQAGRYLPEYRKLREQEKNFLAFCYSPDLTVEAALQPLARFQPDAAILFSDILVIPDALGQAVRFEEGVGPVLEPLRRSADLEKLNTDRVCEYLSPVFTSIRRLSSALPEDVALIGFAGAPWTVAYYMVEGRSGADGSILKKWAYDDAAGFQKLINILIDTTADYLAEQIKQGVEVIQLFDSWAGLLTGSEFQKWVVEPTREIVSRLRKTNPDIPIIGFPREAGEQTVSYAETTGIDGISIDSAIEPAWARDHLQKKWTVQGNLDNTLLSRGGPALETAAKNILDTFARGPFVFNLGHGILPNTPPEHVAEVSDLVRNYSR